MSLNILPRAKPGPVVSLMIATLVVWILAHAVLQGVTDLLVVIALGAGAIGFYWTLKNWRAGILVFLTWMLFEDLVRKYMGNNMAIYFVKDALAAACCLSFYNARGRERRLSPEPGFVLPFFLFFFWVVLEALNPNSPSVWYGLMGLALYFAFVPLFFLGYALLRNEADLRRFLLLNLIIAGLIAGLGAAQGISGKTLLSPANLAPDIRELGTLGRTAPITHEKFIRPTSVFVSDGRFAAFMSLAWLLGFGTAAFLFIRRLPGKAWVLLIMGIVMVAILLSGSRSTLIQLFISVCAVGLGYLPEIRVRIREGGRLVTSIAAIAVLALCSVVILVVAYPEALNARLAFYDQTLSPTSSASELNYRAWEYPTNEFLKAFTRPNWLLGNGTGTCSLGGQYVTRILGASSVGLGVESGYGNLMLELGVPGLLLWVFWTGALMLSEWRLLRRLRGTALYPVALVIVWFSFVLLFPGMASGLTGYQNFVINAYFWILLGILFSLPAISGRLLISSGAPETVGAR
jgi:hypothetical protein